MDTSTYLSLFLEEMRDNCAGLNRCLLTLERGSTDATLLADILRLCHSCKGNAMTMGFLKTGELAHAMETMFADLRSGTTRITPALIDQSLKAVDALERSLQSIEKTGKEQVDPLIAQALRNPDALAAVPGPESADEGLDTAVSNHIRVDAKKLDTILDLTGEFSVLKLQFLALGKDGALREKFTPLLERFSHLLGELTYQVSESRLVPLDQVFVRFPRLVRDLARSQNKSVAFDMTGTGIELDKTVIDHITTPLIHLLRNAVDHGIETPAQRTAAGKPQEGSIAIRVARREGFVDVTVEDDGAPIEIPAIRTAALQRGFTAAEAAAINDATLLDTLCSSRFSSSQEVTMVSGRGVGLSAVYQTVRSLGGTLSLTQADGRKRFTVSFPLHISVLSAILVSAGGHVYALPFSSIRRMHSIRSGDIHRSLGQQAIVLESDSVPLLHLSQALTGAVPVSSAADADRELPVLLIDHGNGSVALTVDSILRNEDITVKPATAILKAAQIFSGYTILGTGQIALVIDIPSLISRSRQSPAHHS